MKLRAATLLTTLLLAVTATAASDRSIVFDVLLDSRPIGTHRFDIQHAGEGRSDIRSTARFDVRILGLVAYRYRHQAHEQWANGCLAKIDASTDDNGKALQVTQVPDQGCVSTYAYWNPQLLLRQARLLNPQTGEVDAVRFEAMGEETLDIGGSKVLADRHRLRSDKFTIDLWYAKSGEWLQLDSTTETKRMLRYRLASP